MSTDEVGTVERSGDGTSVPGLMSSVVSIVQVAHSDVSSGQRWTVLHMTETGTKEPCQERGRQRVLNRPSPFYEIPPAPSFVIRYGLGRNHPDPVDPCKGGSMDTKIMCTLRKSCPRSRIHRKNLDGLHF